MTSPTESPSQRWIWPIHSASRRGQVVVHGDDVHALAGQPVEVHGQGRHEGLALAGLHLGDPAEVQRGAAHQLDVVVALADGAPGALADDGERLDQQVVERLPVVEPLTELTRLGLQRVVGELLDLRLERVDVGNESGEGLDLAPFAGAQQLVEYTHEAVESRTLDRFRSQQGALRARPAEAARIELSGPCQAQRHVTVSVEFTVARLTSELSGRGRLVAAHEEEGVAVRRHRPRHVPGAVVHGGAWVGELRPERRAWTRSRSTCSRCGSCRRRSCRTGTGGRCR